MGETKGEDISDVRGKVPYGEFQSGFCISLKDDIDVGRESIISKSLISTPLHDMVSDDPAGRFPYHMTSVTLWLSSGTLVSHIGCVTAL